MNRPKYKELYLQEKRKEKFSYNLLLEIVNMMKKLGLKAEIEKRFRKDCFMKTIILKAHNPSNDLVAYFEMNRDLLEGGSNENNKKR